ncbi:hypothetical protein BC89_04825, partial [Pseudomonas monteilii]
KIKIKSQSQSQSQSRGRRLAECGHRKQIRTQLQLLHATWRLRLPPPVKECRLALEEFRCRCQGVGGTRIAQMHIFS